MNNKSSAGTKNPHKKHFKKRDRFNKSLNKGIKLVLRKLPINYSIELFTNNFNYCVQTLEIPNESFEIAHFLVGKLR